MLFFIDRSNNDLSIYSRKDHYFTLETRLNAFQILKEVNYEEDKRYVKHCI